MAIKTEGGAYPRTIATATNLTAAGGPYYYPSNAGVDHYGLDDLNVGIVTTFPTAGDTYTITVEVSNDAASWVNVTPAAYDAVTPTSGQSGYVFQNGARLTAWLDFDNLNARYFRVKVVVTDDGSPNNTLSITIRDKVSTGRA